MIIYPNAKINIGLDVLEKREDGYHDISSVFYPVKDLFDVLEVFPANRFSFSSSGIKIPGKENICIRAFEMLSEEFDLGNLQIHLHKQIPIGAGLGGGSADGAFMLKAMNKIFRLNLSANQLEKYALELGADCPFFIHNTPKYIQGVGENMSMIDLNLLNYEVRFIFPELHIATIAAYASIIPDTPKKNLLKLISQPIEKWKGTVKNDFESITFSKYPQLQEMKNQLYIDGAIYASMTGTGSVLYGIFER